MGRLKIFQRLTFLLVFGFLLGAPPLTTPLAAAQSGNSLPRQYAQSVWPTGHRDASNTDYVPMVMSRNNRISKRLLEGHPLFWAPISAPNGDFYVSSGKGPGHSNLHAFTADGELLWKSAPQESLDDLDSYAIINAPVVDRNGHIYVGDINQLWAFYPDGQLKWVHELTQYDIQYGFMTVVLSHGGAVGGISSNGKVIFLNSESGKLLVPVLDLPGGNGPPAADTPPRLLWAGLMDPELIPIMFNLIQGWEMEVANTPALHPSMDRIYITAAGIDGGTGALYGIDLKKDRLEIMFSAPMGGGSGTSPTVSHDGKQVYALDEAGKMVAIDAYTGKPVWETAQGGGGAASPSVGKDGKIYTASQNHLLAFSSDGTPVFNYSYDDFCADQIPAVSGLWKFFFSPPAAFVDSLLTVSAKEGWLNIVCGHHLLLLPNKSERTKVPIPLLSTVVAIDLESGAPLGDPLILPETSEGFIMPSLDGNTFVTLSGAISSIYYHALNPFLPQRFEVPNEPKAGLLLLEPVSRIEYASESLAWIQEQITAAQAKLSTGDRSSALHQLRESELQRSVTRATIKKLSKEGLVLTGTQKAGLEALEPGLQILEIVQRGLEKDSSTKIPMEALQRQLSRASELLAKVTAGLSTATP